MRSKVWCACAVLATGGLLSAATVVLYNELNTLVENFYLVTGEGPLYVSFSTGSSPVSLTDVMANLIPATELDVGARPATPSSGPRSPRRSGAAANARPRN